MQTTKLTTEQAINMLVSGACRFLYYHTDKNSPVGMVGDKLTILPRKLSMLTPKEAQATWGYLAPLWSAHKDKLC